MLVSSQSFGLLRSVDRLGLWWLSSLRMCQNIQSVQFCSRMESRGRTLTSVRSRGAEMHFATPWSCTCPLRVRKSSFPTRALGHDYSGLEGRAEIQVPRPLFWHMPTSSSVSQRAAPPPRTRHHAHRVSACCREQHAESRVPARSPVCPGVFIPASLRPLRCRSAGAPRSAVP